VTDGPTSDGPAVDDAAADDTAAEPRRSGREQAALEQSPEAQERLLAEAREFLERYNAVPPAERRLHTRDDRFSGPFGVTADGEVDVVEEPPEE
jgi:hypothetical protein